MQNNDDVPNGNNPPTADTAAAQAGSQAGPGMVFHNDSKPATKKRRTDVGPQAQQAQQQVQQPPQQQAPMMLPQQMMSQPPPGALPGQPPMQPPQGAPVPNAQGTQDPKGAAQGMQQPMWVQHKLMPTQMAFPVQNGWVLAPNNMWIPPNAPMSMWMPPAAQDTSQDHLLRPPVA